MIQPEEHININNNISFCVFLILTLVQHELNTHNTMRQTQQQQQHLLLFLSPSDTSTMQINHAQYNKMNAGKL